MDKLVFLLSKELEKISQEIMEYGWKKGYAIGTTATIVVLCKKQYSILHVGDSRVYQVQQRISTKVKQITKDQSMNDYMLTQSIGATPDVKPVLYHGTLEKGNMLLLCTDGFRHKNTRKDLERGLVLPFLKTPEDIESKLRLFVERARKLGEQDDISVIAIRLI